MSIRQRLLRVEDDFLAAVITGSVEIFDEQWTILLQDVEGAIQLCNLDDETITLVHATSLRIATLAETFRDLHADNEKLTAHFMDELNVILFQLTLEDTPSHSSSSPLSSPSSNNFGIENTPPFIHRELSPVSQYFDRHSSPTPSLVSLSTAADSDEDSIPVPIIGRKRNASSLDDFVPASESSDRIIKRLRTTHFTARGIKEAEEKSTSVFGSPDDPLCPSTFFTRTSSPTQDDKFIPSRVDVALEPTCEPPSIASFSRKRRLSDVDAYGPLKRPRGHSGPRLHAVSDPFPIGSVPAEAHSLDDWLKVQFGSPDASLLSWGEVEASAPVQVDFFDAWASMSTLPGDHCSGTITKSSDLAQLVPPSLPATMLYPPADEYSDFPKADADFVAVASLPQIPFLSASTDSVLVPPILGATPSPMTPKQPSPSCQLELPNIAVPQLAEPDVISLYTTLCDTDTTLIPAACGNFSQPILDISVTSPTIFSESVGGEEEWAQIFDSTDQPPKVILPSLPPPHNPSTDVSRLLEYLFQTVEVASVSGPDCSHTPNKQTILKELEAAKEAVRRLEAEIGITA